MDSGLADDASEQIFQAEGLKAFQEHEHANEMTPLGQGPLHDFLKEINKIQTLEEEKKLVDPDYEIRLHVSIVTARNAPAHARAVASLKSWGVTVNDAFFLGGIDKGLVLEVLRPHIFFDDQELHLEATSRAAPSVHIPFGLINEAH